MCARECRFVRGFSMGNHRRRPGLVGNLRGREHAGQGNLPIPEGAASKRSKPAPQRAGHKRQRVVAPARCARRFDGGVASLLTRFLTMRSASCASSLTDTPPWAAAGRVGSGSGSSCEPDMTLMRSRSWAGLPTWEYDYRPARLGYRGQPIPKIADEVPLSIHGMAYVYPAVLPSGSLSTHSSQRSGPPPSCSATSAPSPPGQPN
jgi:hypothetical protein